MENFKYQGNELELFSNASCWKAYWSRFLKPVIKGNVLEVGAGIGSSTLVLSASDYQSWTCLEPDPDLAKQLHNVLKKNISDTKHKVITGYIEDIAVNIKFDTILYIDVLEHIEDDRKELENAARQLTSHGKLIVLSPAHQWLFSDFDRAIGHFRRYNKKTFNMLIPDTLAPLKYIYLDSFGLFASLANRFLLKHEMPGERQITVWDKFLVPCSRIIDPLLFFTLGKSILVVLEKVDTNK